MAPKDAETSNKFVAANKIFVSIIPDSSALIPEKLLASSETDVPSRAFLVDTPEDDNAWFKFLKVAKTPELLEEACVLYPKYWKVYYRLALFHVLKRDTAKAFEVFNDSLRELNDFGRRGRRADLHLKYLMFLYHTGSIHEYIGCLFNTVEKVGAAHAQAGLDYRSDFVWRELATVLVKIYNCNLLALGLTSGLLPDLFATVRAAHAQDQVLLKTPLVPSETEQMIFRAPNALDPANRTYLQMYGELNVLRNLLHKVGAAHAQWLKTPTNNMRGLWDAYSVFENTVDSSGTLSTKLLGDMKLVINMSMRAYEVGRAHAQRMTELYSKVYPIKAASYESTAAAPAHTAEALNNWMDIIKFEESNPMELPFELLAERVLFNFERALCPLVFSREMWYRYFQFLLLTDRRDRGRSRPRAAIAQLSTALNKFLKEDGRPRSRADKLRFVLALYLEESGDVERAHQEFASLVSPSFRAGEADLDARGELKLRQLLECKDYQAYEKSELDGIVHYLNFVRREVGAQAWREQVHTILEKSDLNSWDLYWYAASTELRVFKDYDQAVLILKQAHSKMAFSFKHTMLFFNTMLNVGKHNDVRILLSDLIVGSADRSAKITEKDRDALWNFWMNMEYLYGSADQFDHVKNLYVTAAVATRAALGPNDRKPKGRAGAFTLFADVVAAFDKSAASAAESADGFSSAVQNRARLFCSGIEFDHLDKIFKFNFNHEPPAATAAPSPTRVKAEEEAPEPEKKADRKTKKADKKADKKAAEKAPEKPAKKESRRSRKRARANADKAREQEEAAAEAAASARGAPQDAAGDAPANVKYGTKVCRPNVSRLSEIDPKMTTALESLVQLHGAKRPILPPKFRPLDSMGTPSKALFDLIRILPSTRDNKFANLYVSSEAVDYLIRTVENMDLGNIELDRYEPLPTNLSAQIRETVGRAHAQDETLNEKSFQFNQGLENILRFLQVGAPQPQDNALFDDRPEKRHKIAI